MLILVNTRRKTKSRESVYTICCLCIYIYAVPNDLTFSHAPGNELKSRREEGGKKVAEEEDEEANARLGKRKNVYTWKSDAAHVHQDVRNIGCLRSYVCRVCLREANVVILVCSDKCVALFCWM